MYLIIDTCCLAQVFDPKNQQHLHFAPVLKWVAFGKGRMVYGGTKYNNELRQAPKFLRIVVELERARRAIKIPKDKVDPIAAQLKKQVDRPDFNDEHLLALVIASRCCVVCTNDTVAIVYLKYRELYSDYNVKRPKIYSSKRNQSLCCDRHLAQICTE